MPPGLTMDKWGPSAWTTLHVFAHTAPKRLTLSEAHQWALFLDLFGQRLPCPKCRLHFSDFLERKLDMESLRTREDLVALLNDAHNEVNARNGKRVYTLEEHYRMYQVQNTSPIGGVLLVGLVCGLTIVALRVAKQRPQKILWT